MGKAGWLRLCLDCRRKVEPCTIDGCGVYYHCGHCRVVFTKQQIELYVDNAPGGVTYIGAQA